MRAGDYERKINYDWPYLLYFNGGFQGVWVGLFEYLLCVIR